LIKGRETTFGKKETWTKGGVVGRGGRGNWKKKEDEGGTWAKGGVVLGGKKCLSIGRGLHGGGGVAKAYLFHCGRGRRRWFLSLPMGGLALAPRGGQKSHRKRKKGFGKKKKGGKPGEDH